MHTKPIRDSIVIVPMIPDRDTITIYKKKLITMPLTTAESLGIGNIEYPIIQKMKVDSFIDKAKKNKSEMIVLKGKDTIKK